MTYTPLGDLVQGRPGVIGFGIDNTSTTASPTLTATVALPTGVLFTGLESSGSPFDGLGGAIPPALARDGSEDWTCTGTDTGATCTHPPLEGGRSTRAYLQVDAAAGSAGSVPVSVTVSADGLAPVTVTGSRGVQTAGLTTRYAATGPLAVTEIGNALLSCPTSATGCATARLRQGGKQNDDDWPMTWYATDPAIPTQASSAATLDLPADGQVRWAGLYWSGFWTGDAQETLGLRGPGSSAYTTVAANRTDFGSERGQSVFQSYADVTALVQSGGAGTWWAANPQLRTGATFYGGWALVVVHDAPGAASQQVTVFDGLSSVTSGGAPQSTVVAALPGGPARIGAVLWEGDAGINGDSLSLDGTALSPQGGSMSATNVADSSANGAVGPTNTFGTDVDSFVTTFPATGTPVVTAATVGDTYFLGVLTVSGG